MADALKGQGQVEKDEADALKTTAATIGAAALTRTTLVAAQEAIRAVQADGGAGTVGEPVADLRRLRANPRLSAAIQADLRVAQSTALVLIQDALFVGYRTAAIGRTKAATTDRLTFDVSNLEADRGELRGWPILGHTPAEVAANLTTSLDYALAGALALPLTGSIDPATIPAAIGAVSSQHGDRLGAAVSEAYFAGVQSATRAIGAALVGA